MSVFELDRKAQGIPQPFAEPPAAVRAALPKFAEALAKLDALRDKQNRLFMEVERLRAGLPAARQLDREAMAAAAAADEPTPPPVAAETERMIADVTRRAVALTDLIDKEQEQASRAIMRHRDGWAKNVEPRLVEHVGQYTALIDELDRVRQAIVDDINTKSWLEHYPEQAPLPQTAFIPQPDVLADQPKRSWTQYRDDLLRDAEALPNTAGVPIDTRRALALYNHGAGFQAVTGGRRRWIR